MYNIFHYNYYFIYLFVHMYILFKRNNKTCFTFYEKKSFFMQMLHFYLAEKYKISLMIKKKGKSLYLY